MTLEDWFGPAAGAPSHALLPGLSDRKLHLLTAALLRRVWDDLPSDLTRIAVEATEKHADGRMTAYELARLRSADLLDTGKSVWAEPGYPDDDLIGAGCPCSGCTAGTAAYECQLAGNIYALDGVTVAVRYPVSCVLRAARYARSVLFRPG